MLPSEGLDGVISGLRQPDPGFSHILPRTHTAWSRWIPLYVLSWERASACCLWTRKASSNGIGSDQRAVT